MSRDRIAGWLAVNTHTHKERVARDNLERQGFAVYCPMLRKQVRHARKTSEVLRPFFPGYLFAAAHEGQGLRALYSTLGVRAVVGSSEHPARLSDDFVTALKAREVDGAIVRPSLPYSIGQQVRMTGGAFDGLVATIVAMDEKDRLTVLLDLLNQQVKVRTGGAGVSAI